LKKKGKGIGGVKNKNLKYRFDECWDSRRPKNFKDWSPMFKRRKT